MLLCITRSERIKILGLDLALTNSGAVILEDGVAGDRWLLRTSAEAPDIERYDYVAKQVIGIVFGQSNDAGIDLVVCEGVYASRNLLTFGRLTALSSVVQYALYRSKVPCLVLPPAAWRKIVFGPGSKVDKERLRTYAATRLKAHLGTIDVEQVDLNVLEAAMVALAGWKVAQDPSLIPAPKRKRRSREAA